MPPEEEVIELHSTTCEVFLGKKNPNLILMKLLDFTVDLQKTWGRHESTP